MNRVMASAVIGILSALPAFAQANQTDSQTLQSILTEVRAIHNEVRLSQTTQLLLTELELQQTVVNRAIQRRDDFQSQASQLQVQQKDVDERLAHFQTDPDPGFTPDQKKDFADMKEDLEHKSADLKGQRLESANELQDAQSSLSREQGTLDSIQRQLNDVVKKLQPVPNE